MLINADGIRPCEMERVHDLLSVAMTIHLFVDVGYGPGKSHLNLLEWLARWFDGLQKSRWPSWRRLSSQRLSRGLLHYSLRIGAQDTGSPSFVEQVLLRSQNRKSMRTWSNAGCIGSNARSATRGQIINYARREPYSTVARTASASSRW